MAYASKYYDPEKAHAYYMKTRVLKGYENRYGGARGNGTSAASGGIFPVDNSSGKTVVATRSGTSSSSAGKTVVATRSGNLSSGAGKTTVATRSGSSSNSSSGTKTKAQETQEHNQKIQKQISEKREKTRRQIQDLRDELNNMSPEDRKANQADIQRRINILRQESNDEIQILREQQRGGSTAGFNQKGIEAAVYIKDQMEKERDDIIKKTNKDTDNEMLDSVKRLAADIKAMRESGRGFSHQQFKARIKAMLGQTKKKKIKSKRKHMSDYKQKYKDEIDKLRGDRSMYTYWDKNPGIREVL